MARRQRQMCIRDRGIIENFILPTASNYYEISIRLFEDIGSIQNVYVVKNKFRNEINELEKNNE